MRNYGYKYDQLNRLKDATYQKSGQLTNMYNENLTYDKNGNIMNLSRYGDRDEQYLPIQIDNLGYNYGTNSNQLKSVTDATNNTSGFKDGNTTGDDYVYDANGNMTVDKNKNITGIVYNHLNLPTKIIFPTGNIVYFYNASGQKVQKVVTENTTVTTTDYLGGYQYKNAVLQFFPTAEGYVKNTLVSGTNTYSYVFNYTDHLGNTRLSYTKDTITGSLKILEESNYFPFGLKHNSYNVDNFQQDYKYKYNGKELQDELWLNLYDYGFRNYDPAIGRFMNVDLLAEISRRWSPYTYTYSNPVLFIDVDGLYVDTSWIYRKNKDGNYINKKLVEAFETFAKSKEGISFLGNFAEKGQVIAGHEYTESGKFDKKDIDLNYAEAKNEESVGDAYTSEKAKGKGLQITINLSANGTKVDNMIDDIGHESFLHAEPKAKDFYDDKILNLSPIDKDIVQQLKDVKYPKSWMENAAHHTQDERHRILEKKLFPILKNYYRRKKVKKTDEEIKKSVNGYVK